MANNSRTSKIDRNREKVIQDRLQLLLTRMLQDEDNKYCVDCDAKGTLTGQWKKIFEAVISFIYENLFITVIIQTSFTHVFK